MLVAATTSAPAETDADTVALGVFEGEQDATGAPADVAEILSSGEARSAPGAVAVAHGAGKRWIVVGLGSRTEFTPERARAAAAHVRGRAREISTRSLCWSLPAGGDDAAAAGPRQGPRPPRPHVPA